MDHDEPAVVPALEAASPEDEVGGIAPRHRDEDDGPVTAAELELAREILRREPHWF